MADYHHPVAIAWEFSAYPFLLGVRAINVFNSGAPSHVRGALASHEWFIYAGLTVNTVLPSRLYLTSQW
jgi:hypothetical protein